MGTVDVDAVDVETAAHEPEEIRPRIPAGAELRRNADGKMVLVGPACAAYMGLSTGEEGLVELLDGVHCLDDVVAAGLGASPQVRPLGVLAMLRRLDRVGLLQGMERHRERLFGAEHRTSNAMMDWLERVVDIRLQEDPPGLVTLPTALGRLVPRGLWTAFHVLAIAGLVSALGWAAAEGRLKELLTVFPRGPQPLELLTALYVMAACVLSIRGLMRGILMRSRGMVVRRAGMRILWGIAHLDVDDRERRAASRDDRLHLALIGITSLCDVAACAGWIALLTGSGIARLVCAVSLLCLLVNLAPYLRTDARELVGILTTIPGMRKRCIAYLHRRALAPWRKSTSTKQDWAYSSSVSLWLAHGALTIYLLGDRVVPGALTISGDLIGGRVPLPDGATWLLPIAGVVMGLMLVSLLGLVLGMALLVLSFTKQLLLGWVKPAAAANKEAGQDSQAAFVEAAPGIPFLSGLSPEDLQVLAGKLRHESYDPGGTVILQGDTGDRFCFIQRGRCVVEIEETSGLVHEAAHLGPGDFFGEVALLEDVPRTATVRASEAVEVLSLDRASFLALLEEVGASPEVVLTQIRNAAFVRHHRFFQTVPATRLRDLLGRLKERRLEPNEVVVRQGEGGRSLYIIREGTCVVDHQEGDGVTHEVARLGTGDHFGEIALLGDGVRTATVRADDAAVVLEVPQDLFQDVLLKNFETVIQLDRGCADRLNLLQAR